MLNDWILIKLLEINHWINIYNWFEVNVIQDGHSKVNAQKCLNQSVSQIIC